MTVPVVNFTVAASREPFRYQGGYVVIYDGNCKICTRLAGVLRTWARHDQIQIVPSQLAGVRSSFPFISSRDDEQSLQMIGPGLARWQGARAIEELLTILPRGAWIGWIFSVPGVRGLADRVYRWIARHRYQLGCGEHCAYRPQ